LQIPQAPRAAAAAAAHPLTTLSTPSLKIRFTALCKLLSVCLCLSLFCLLVCLALSC
jgi:hypothetical protein